ncbi:hypothetical protein HLRTI_002018 [Halorhabdus tiamatea SARL4B]|uniref:Hypothetical membrane protein n=1 Tax=Halorhabdus tiamatea SARL4B TaxID=1033806 RepID=F7PKJ4_9EURY|nr:hypothetical protein [Halorhabdus tiamatea]ERJ05990.1 hypothetical protein HLRTI_002018 [Halorhabdus tiamatea SARL4B]CCQ33977.1 hypothetical membrane protein [Halorhabdus tiamatea SARL4B]
MFDFLTFLALSLQGAILGLLVVAVRRRNVPAAVNALASLALAVVPTALELGFRAVGEPLALDPLLAVWLGVAGFLHSIGMLGLYDSTWWWDHLTHTISAALVAAFFYAALLVAVPSVPARTPVVGVGAITVATTFAIGVFWELIELVARDVADRLDVDPVLVHYGWRDTAIDLVFDVVGAVVIVVLDVQVFVSIVEQFPALTEGMVIASGWGVAIVSVAMALFVTVGSIRT